MYFNKKIAFLVVKTENAIFLYSKLNLQKGIFLQKRHCFF